MDGIDPIEERAEMAGQAAETPKAMKFKECAEGYIAAHNRAGKATKHAEQWAATLEPTPIRSSASCLCS